MKAATKVQSKIIDATVAFWRQKSALPVSDEDARQMVRNVAGFFSVLAEWDLRDRERKQPRTDGEVMP